jgi:hypothetical protein
MLSYNISEEESKELCGKCKKVLKESIKPGAKDYLILENILHNLTETKNKLVKNSYVSKM